MTHRIEEDFFSVISGSYTPRSGTDYCIASIKLDSDRYVTRATAEGTCKDIRYPAADPRVDVVREPEEPESPTGSLEAADLPGTWLEVDRFADKQGYLIINEDLRPCFSGDTTCDGDSRIAYSLITHDDLTIITATVESEIFHRWVLGGWKHRNQRVLFGTRYIYESGRIINGLDITYRWLDPNDA